MKTKDDILESIEWTRSMLRESDDPFFTLDNETEDSFVFPLTYPLDLEEDKHLYAPEENNETFQEDFPRLRERYESEPDQV